MKKELIAVIALLFIIFSNLKAQTLSGSYTYGAMEWGRTTYTFLPKNRLRVKLEGGDGDAAPPPPILGKPYKPKTTTTTITKSFYCIKGDSIYLNTKKTTKQATGALIRGIDGAIKPNEIWLFNQIWPKSSL